MPIVAREPLAAAVAAAAARLDAGDVAVVPTDTVYGLAARAEDPAALEELYRRKGRDRTIPTAVLLAHGAEADRLWRHASSGRRRLVSRFWPGPLTVVDERSPRITWDLGGDPTSIGLRCPDHPFIRALVEAVGPLAVSSANRSGLDPLTRVGQVEGALGTGLTVVVDGGVLTGTASTVVDLRSGLEVRRAGPIAESDLRAAWVAPTMNPVEGA